MEDSNNLDPMVDIKETPPEPSEPISPQRRFFCAVHGSVYGQRMVTVQLEDPEVANILATHGLDLEKLNRRNGRVLLCEEHFEGKVGKRMTPQDVRRLLKRTPDFASPVRKSRPRRYSDTDFAHKPAAHREPTGSEEPLETDQAQRIAGVKQRALPYGDVYGYVEHLEKSLQEALDSSISDDRPPRKRSKKLSI